MTGGGYLYEAIGARNVFGRELGGYSPDRRIMGPPEIQRRDADVRTLDDAESVCTCGPIPVQRGVEGGTIREDAEISRDVGFGHAAVGECRPQCRAAVAPQNVSDLC